MASQELRNDLGRQIANVVHMFRIEQRRDPMPGVLPPDQITVEQTETGYSINVFEPKPSKRSTRKTDSDV